MPNRSGARRLRDRALAIALRLLAFPFAAIPWRAAQAAGGWIGRLGWFLSRRDRGRTIEHLAIAFPDWTARQHDAVARACFEHWGTSLGEVLHHFGRRPDAILDHLDAEGWEHVEAAQAAGRAILVLASHCGNWELMTGYLPRRGLELAAIARRLDDPMLDHLLVTYRARFGARTIARGSREASRKLREVARGRSALAVLIDQDTAVDGAWVPFFGRLAYTPTGAAQLARRLDAVVLPFSIERLKTGRHLVRVEPPLDLPEDPIAATALMTERIEAHIRRRPEQWVWMHRRWRRRPPQDAAPTPRRVGTIALALVAALGIAVGLSSCGQGPAPAAWTRFDLWSEPPRVESRTGRWRTANESVVSFLGTAEVRDLARIPAAQLAHFPRRTAGQIRALAQAPGSRLAWTVELGAEPYLSFVPLGANCGCEYRVSARVAAAAPREIARVAAAAPAVFAAASVEVDLRDYAGSSIDLLLEVHHPVETESDAPAKDRRALWGSPAVWSRRPPTPSNGATPERPNILLVGFDTLRADAVGARAQGISLTPAWDQLAAEADTWSDAFSTFNATNPSFASILTGLYGKNHGVHDLATRLPAEHETLPELLSAAGYRTRAVISASHLGDHNSGLGQGFDSVVTATEHHAAELAVDALLEWLEEPSERPFFAWLHLFDPHTPHTPPAPYALGERPATARGLAPLGAWTPFRSVGPRAFSEHVLGAERDLYDGEVAYLDRQLDRLVDWLRSRGWLETTLVVLVADHGENLGDHGINFRHVGLWDSTTRVPLLVRWPGPARPGRRIAGLVQTIDLFPTVLGAAGLDRREDSSDGIDLRQLTGEGRSGRRVVFAEHAGGLGAMVRLPGWKLIRSAGNPFLPDGDSLYDLREDPGEIDNLAGQGRSEEEQLRRLLDAWLASRRPAPGQAAPVELSPEEIEKLRALGYL